MVAVASPHGNFYLFLDLPFCMEAISVFVVQFPLAVVCSLKVRVSASSVYRIYALHEAIVWLPIGAELCCGNFFFTSFFPCAFLALKPQVSGEFFYRLLPNSVQKMVCFWQLVDIPCEERIQTPLSTIWEVRAFIPCFEDVLLA